MTMSVSAKEFSCTKYSKLPVVFQACEGEGPCGYFRDDKALVRVPIYEQPFKTSKIIDYLGKGETIRETEPYLVVKKLGKVRVMTANNILRAKGIKKDDIVPLVKTNDEYQVEICVGDKVIEVNDVYEQFPDFVKIIEQNKTEAWVKLKTPRNVVGYALDISEPGADQWYIHILS
ncbi:MAG: hypothetical protein HY559_05515 [Gammaproteobacteria bacterium]|nr:hypothetical protein [Gammaproteobacteria bacterium]